MNNAPLTRFLLMFLALAILSGCSFVGTRDFPLQVTTSDQHTYVVQQQWQVYAQGRDYALEVIVERRAARWRLIMLNQLGQRLVTVESDGQRLHVERHLSHPATRQLPDLLQAWQFGFWPLADLQGVDPRWVFSEGNGRREVYFSGILRATIERLAVNENKAGDSGPQAASGLLNPWQGSLSYNTADLRLLIHSQPLN
ncbi:DUF3261 domain-containing protein [Cellvibrio japonicus]|uniref:Uncharacterized protein n=1 Tax=Cellvibrio japonicus (strain Ueda107) TaxID=498211 RepID=B3PFJ8_CELJU|nr:DUF3261 domain-containing protein [Cellvibrio japonicus]ACE86208.1 hypothetical protein CJA_0114 [Cellvibrio japonicus Ueda107]QEI10863.1 DUF3261 domain-containing protein [Cellvibrio japonicus]QEI14439.1 DUF3261 domain-containing protein [Cellvibrio japonicus]QEI18017.1 DUF3261 domain-containing protein [Cellvibrio japonicus]